MRFAIFGAGAVGGYLGAHLAAAGEDVVFVARGAHLDAIREKGLRIESPSGDLHIHPAQASDNPADIGPVDVVLFAVKLFDTAATAAACRPLMGPETTVIGLQNGVEAHDIIGGVLGPERVMGGRDLYRGGDRRAGPDPPDRRLRQDGLRRDRRTPERARRGHRSCS